MKGAATRSCRRFPSLPVPSGGQGARRPARPGPAWPSSTAPSPGPAGERSYGPFRSRLSEVSPDTAAGRPVRRELPLPGSPPVRLAESSGRSAAAPTALMMVMFRKWSISSWVNWRILYPNESTFLTISRRIRQSLANTAREASSRSRRSTTPKSAATSSSVTSLPQKASTWSSTDRASRMLPSPLRAIMVRPASVIATSSWPTIWRRCFAITASGIRLKSKR